ncbi:MAG: hypothetical protein JNL53_20045, partial [Cyclobacteriaceae bacterium]|nr:hypothetical protein [Cyclobacteriaceae bacterium]
RADREFNNLNKMYGVIGDDDLNGSDFSRYGPGGINSLQGFVYDPVTKRYVTQDFKNGEFGIWEDWSFVYYGEENLSGETWRLATVIKLLQWVPGSLNHYHTMSNRVTQKIHQGQQGFVDNPFGGAMMMLVTGGGLGGGGAIAGRALSGLKAMSPFVIRSGAALGQLTRTSSSIVMSNLVQTGARNGVINLSAQLFFNEGDFGDIDFLDVFTSSIAGNSFVFAGASSAFFDGSINSGFSTAASSSIYSTSVKAATGIAFGSLGGKVGSALGPGGSGFFPELTINIIGSLFGWTLSPPTKR